MGFFGSTVSIEAPSQSFKAWWFCSRTETVRESKLHFKYTFTSHNKLFVKDFSKYWYIEIIICFPGLVVFIKIGHCFFGIMFSNTYTCCLQNILLKCLIPP